VYFQTEYVWVGWVVQIPETGAGSDSSHHCGPHLGGFIRTNQGKLSENHFSQVPAIFNQLIIK